MFGPYRIVIRGKYFCRDICGSHNTTSRYSENTVFFRPICFVKSELYCTSFWWGRPKHFAPFSLICTIMNVWRLQADLNRTFSRSVSLFSYLSLNSNTRSNEISPQAINLMNATVFMHTTVFMHIELNPSPNPHPNPNPNPNPYPHILALIHSVMNELDFATMYKGRQDTFRLNHCLFLLWYPISNNILTLFCKCLSSPPSIQSPKNHTSHWGSWNPPYFSRVPRKYFQRVQYFIGTQIGCSQVIRLHVMKSLGDRRALRCNTGKSNIIPYQNN